MAVRLFDVADFLGEGDLCAFALFPGFHVVQPVSQIEGSGRSGSDVGVRVCRGFIYFTIVGDCLKAVPYVR